MHKNFPKKAKHNDKIRVYNLFIISWQLFPLCLLNISIKVDTTSKFHFQVSWESTFYSKYPFSGSHKRLPFSILTVPCHDPHPHPPSHNELFVNIYDGFLSLSSFFFFFRIRNAIQISFLCVSVLRGGGGGVGRGGRGGGEGSIALVSMLCG
jgi:hypothetical protein